VATQLGAKSSDYSDECFVAQMNLIKEFIDNNEFELAYEELVLWLEDGQFLVSGRTAVRLLEMGLLLGFKSGKECDSRYDRRSRLSTMDRSTDR
jgi:hypothetical protein